MAQPWAVEFIPDPLQWKESIKLGGLLEWLKHGLEWGFRVDCRIALSQPHFNDFLGLV